jgi:formylglycine-generating enzyme required for sulfatase activity
MKSIKDFAEVKTLWPSPEAFERGRRDPPYFAEESDLSEKWPIEDVTCFQALAFVRSRGKDLFTVEEWFAAKGRIEGGELRKLPGLLTDMNRAGHPVVVDQGGVALSYNKAGQSVHHLAGNAAEWTRPEKGARSAPLMGGSYRDTDERYCSGERTIAMDLGESRRCCGFRGVLRPREFFGALATN